jgi:hypothetical protein
MRIILITHKKTGAAECFSSLKPFYAKHPIYEAKKDNIDNYLSRKKKPYETDDIKIQRLEVQGSYNCT